MPVLREKLQARVHRAIRPCRPRSVRHLRHQRRPDAGHARAVESGRRGDRLRSLLRHVRRAGQRWSGRKVVYVDTYPDFRIDLDRVAAAITPRTKIILFNSPNNPTGAVAGEDEVRGLAELAAERNVVLLSDEIYRAFCYDQPLCFAGPVQSADAGRRRLQQDLRRAGLAAGIRPRAGGHHPRDDQIAAIQLRLCAAAGTMGGGRGHGRGHEPADRSLSPQARHARWPGWPAITTWCSPAGHFTPFPGSPGARGMEFVTRAIERHQLLMIPGSVFSRRDTHFRISYAAPDAVIHAASRRCGTWPRKGEGGDATSSLSFIDTITSEHLFH